MTQTKDYIEKLFTAHQISITPSNQKIFDEYVLNEQVVLSVKLISEHQQQIMENWQLKDKINTILNQHLQIPNGTVGKPYHYQFDFKNLKWDDIVYVKFIGIDDTGLTFDSDTKTITGKPIISGDFKLKLCFRINKEDASSALNEKVINLIINADPKSLWKDIPSDKTDRFWKVDQLSVHDKLGEKHIVVSSKRGRSHANVGSFRDDDFAFKYFEQTGWSVVAVSDGAGGYKNTRKGSEIACQEVISFFETNLSKEASAYFDELVTKHHTASQKSTQIDEPKDETQELTQVLISKFIYDYLGRCAKQVYHKLDDFALNHEFELKELHSTLIFALFKKYSFGYVVLTFGVGDCPIALVNKQLTEFKLMNWLDVGEFGGGTRFISMPEIFTSDKFATRFGFKVMEDFSYLFLMTDGVYDAKFEVEANLEKLEKWKEFIADLNGKNEDNAKVVFEALNPDIVNQLSTWMDFWSPGNHDDRTLAIVF